MEMEGTSRYRLRLVAEEAAKVKSGQTKPQTSIDDLDYALEVISWGKDGNVPVGMINGTPVRLCYAENTEGENARSEGWCYKARGHSGPHYFHL
jgi:hypothetical protein